MGRECYPCEITLRIVSQYKQSILTPLIKFKFSQVYILTFAPPWILSVHIASRLQIERYFRSSEDPLITIIHILSSVKATVNNPTGSVEKLSPQEVSWICQSCSDYQTLGQIQIQSLVPIGAPHINQNYPMAHKKSPLAKRNSSP